MIRNGLVAAAAAVLLLAGCSTMPPHATDPTGGIAPREAILAAADAAPNGVNGVFVLLVRATGRQSGQIYLNSELDYRDQRNLTVAIAPRAADALAQRYGMPADRFFANKAIRVRGAARRVRIEFTTDGRPTGKYYYQTHVAVSSPDQIAVARS